MNICNGLSTFLTLPTRQIKHWFFTQKFEKLSPHIKSSCYKSLVVPIIEYGSTVWDLHLHKDINKIEKIQRCAARFVKIYYSWDTSVISLINDLQCKTLQSRRTFLKLTMMYEMTLLYFALTMYM